MAEIKTTNYFLIQIFETKLLFRIKKQAGAELGQAQLKLGLGFTC